MNNNRVSNNQTYNHTYVLIFSFNSICNVTLCQTKKHFLIKIPNYSLYKTNNFFSKIWSQARSRHFFNNNKNLSIIITYVNNVIIFVAQIKSVFYYFRLSIVTLHCTYILFVFKNCFISFLLNICYQTCILCTIIEDDIHKNMVRFLTYRKRSSLILSFLS
ncbi:hypothetical protein PUN28_016006 [Cardiocondyla obscurior]|uniref:Transmembrane protein n=1 Tax=Cardiocondyla obscurior TaxID=286306 RepID=A0AAW2ET62_9HYME